MIKKNTEYTGTVVDYNAAGNALVAIEDSLFAVDARRCVVGETVQVRVLNVKQKQAMVLAVLDSSGVSDRVTAPCSHFGVCGGCSLQHLDYAAQCLAKSRMVEQALLPLGPLELAPCIPCQKTYEYRNKMEYTFSARRFLAQPALAGSPEPEGALGLFVPFSGNKVLDLIECPLQASPSTAIRHWFKDYTRLHGLSFYHSSRHTGLLRTLLIRNNKKGDVLCMPVFASDDRPIIEQTIADLVSAFPHLASVWYCINPKLNDSYADLSPVHVHGAQWISEDLDGLIFHTGPLAFMQVNPWQTAVLYQKIIELSGIGASDRVYDLYCGAGTISAYAARFAKEVIGIEYVPEAVAHAQETSRLNNIDNARFFAGDMRQLLTAAFFEQEGQPDIIITDPPRAGMHPDVTRLLCTIRPRTLIYVACKAESLARDLAILRPYYRIDLIQVIDLMPHTLHVETIAVLKPLCEVR